MAENKYKIGFGGILIIGVTGALIIALLEPFFSLGCEVIGDIWTMLSRDLASYLMELDRQIPYFSVGYIQTSEASIMILAMAVFLVMGVLGTVVLIFLISFSLIVRWEQKPEAPETKAVVPVQQRQW